MKRSRFLSCLAILLFVPALSAQTDADRDAIRRAVLDYAEGIYEVAPERIERSVHPDLMKVGFFRKGEEITYGAPMKMTYTQLVDLASKFNKTGRVSKEAQRKDVVIQDVMDQTATAKLSAWWGVDYMQLGKFDGKWKIVNIIWQSYPKTGAAMAP